MNALAEGGFIAGARHAVLGLRLITRPGIRAYVIIPLLINIVLFTVALIALGSALDFVVANYLGNWPDWIKSVIWGLLALLSAVMVFFTFSIVANLVASPFNGMLAEAVERHLRPEMSAMSFSWKRFGADLWRTVRSELKKLIYIALRALPLLLLSVIPGLNAAAPLLWFMFGAWMLCLEYLDCPLSNHQQFFPAVLTPMRARRRLALGFGGTITLLTLIPVVNFIAMPIGVAGATALYCRHLSDS